jgi:hypothetical protein
MDKCCVVDFTRNPFESNWYKIFFGIYDQSIIDFLYYNDFKMGSCLLLLTVVVKFKLKPIKTQADTIIAVFEFLHLSK